MLFLFLAILGQTAFGLVLRHLQRTGHNLFCAGAVNYLTCAAGNGLSVLSLGPSLPALPTLTIGLLGGLSYVTTFFLFASAMDLRGLSIAAALARLSVIIPILFSILLWREHPNPYQAIGIAFGLASLALLSLHPGGGHVLPRPVPILLGVFLLNGGCVLAIKAFEEMGPPQQSALFLFILFGTAAAASTTIWLSLRPSFSRGDILWGIVLGASNLVGNVFLLWSLHVLPGVVVFPISSSLGLLLTVILVSAFWREELHRPALIGIALAVVAIVLIKLK